MWSLLSREFEAPDRMLGRDTLFGLGTLTFPRPVTSISDSCYNSSCVVLYKHQKIASGRFASRAIASGSTPAIRAPSIYPLRCFMDEIANRKAN